MAWKYDITFHAIKLENDGVNFEGSLDPYSAFRKASEDSTVPDQPLWGLLVWQVVGIFILGLVLVCAVSCFCCERYSVRIPKIIKTSNVEDDPEMSSSVLLRVQHGNRRLSADSETDC